MCSSFDTVYPADSVEFCPQPAAQDILVCGTYKLCSDLDSDNKSQKRKGICYVFRVDVPSEETDVSIPVLHKLQEINLPAIPDMKWCHRSESCPPLLGIADSEGCITLSEWQSEKGQLYITDTIRCSSPEHLCLSLDWSNRRFGGTEPGSLIVSLSDGHLSHLKPGSDGRLTTIDKWHAHDYEPWSAAWDYWNPNVVYSGGDDLKLKCWDIRQSPTQESALNRNFNAGVTSIQSHAHVEHIIAVGSYDDTVRLIDVRKFQRPLAQVDVGSGPWRVKWHPDAARKTDLLVASMRDGFKVVRFEEEEASSSLKKEYSILSRFDKHDPEGLCYGVDWSYRGEKAYGKNQSTLVASCSFYDHVLHLWTG